MTALTEADVTCLDGVGTNIYPPAEPIDGGAPRFKTGYITVGATADDTDTIDVDLWAQFGITKFLGITGWIHTTANSVIAVEAPTTAVQFETLTITIGGSTNDKQRLYAIYGI